MADITPEQSIRESLGPKGGLEGPSVDELMEDSLTGLKNRLMWEKEAKDHLSHAKRSKENVALVFIDADNLKRTNDTYGHPMGDILLKAIADSMKDRLRKSDLLGRLSGDEFVALLTDFDRTDSSTEADSLTGSILSSIKHKMEDKIPTDDLGISVGLVKWDGLEDLESLIEKADQRMYKRKKNGR